MIFYWTFWQTCAGEDGCGKGGSKTMARDMAMWGLCCVSEMKLTRATKRQIWMHTNSTIWTWSTSSFQPARVLQFSSMENRTTSAIIRVKIFLHYFTLQCASATCYLGSHLQPIIDLAKISVSNLKTVHVFSDGPSSQYRQKITFTWLIILPHFIKLT